jgi:hypothetical protein
MKWQFGRQHWIGVGEKFLPVIKNKLHLQYMVMVKNFRLPVINSVKTEQFGSGGNTSNFVWMLPDSNVSQDTHCPDCFLFVCGFHELCQINAAIVL